MKFLILLFPALVLISCETTQLVYASKSAGELNKIGIARLNKSHRKIDSLFPKLDSNFNASSIKYANRFLAKESIHLDEQIQWQQVDTLKIMQLCARHQLDGIIISYISFRKVQESIYAIPVNSYFECLLSTKIYDKSGRLIYSVVHDSKDDSYEKIPTTYDVVNLSVGISYKRIYSAKQF